MSAETAIAENFLLAEPLLVARLTATIPDAAFVGTATDMEQLSERTQRTPALYVLFDGYTPQENAGRGQIQRITQRWAVIGAVRNVADQAGGSAAREDAGRLVAQILAALQGHRLHPELSALQLAPGAAPEYNAGFSYIPTLWTTATTTRGTPT